MRRALAVVVVVLGGCPAPKGATDSITVVTRPVVPPPVVVVPAALEPPEPTLRLPKNFVPTGYHARLELDPVKRGFSGSIAISGKVSEASSVIWLHGHHLRVTGLVATQGDPFGSRIADEPQLAVEAVGDELLRVRTSRPLAAGEWTLLLDMQGDYDLLDTAGAFKQVVAGDPYVYSQFEATYARRVFPCVDEPDSKVPWTLTLDVPTRLVAVANAPVATETELGNGTKRIAFATTRPLPAYLVAFAVGPFELIDAGHTRTNQPIRVVALKGRARSTAWAVQTTGRLVEILEDYFGTPYPYPKLDLLAIPLTVGFGAMENAGLISFTETLLLQDAPSQERKAAWIRIAGHELAHQWFGDLVTTAWWDDIWLNEGFANWMQAKVAAKFDPSWHAEIASVDMRNTALEADALTTARRVRQPIATSDDILNVFDRITYDKGASVLGMLETYVGPDVFQRGVRAYLDKHTWGNATSADLAVAISEAAGRDVTAAFGTFLDQPGAPELTTSCAAGKVTFAQRRYVPPGSGAVVDQKPWILPVCAAFEKAGKRAEACTLLEGPTGVLDAGKSCPRWIEANAQGRGYYRVAYTASQLTALRDEGWAQLSGAERHDVFFNATNGARLGKLPLQLALSLAPRLLVDNNRFAVGDATALGLQLDWLVPDELRPKYEAWLRGTFGLAIAKVGIVPQETDDLDAERERGELIEAVVWMGKDGKLVDEAVALSKTWRDQPAATRSVIARIAADAKTDDYARLLADVHTVKDRARRGELLTALAAVRDAKRYAQVVELTSDTTLDLRETIWLLYAAHTAAQRAVAQPYFLAHEAELMKRLPADETAGPLAVLSVIFTGTCEASKRDEMATLATQHFAKLAGGERVVAQNIEAMDQCIAQRKLLEPEVRGWLTGVKIPTAPKKPPPPPPAAPRHKRH